MKNLILLLAILTSAIGSSQEFDFGCVDENIYSCFNLEIVGQGTVSEETSSTGSIRYIPTPADGWYFESITYYNGVATTTIDDLVDNARLAPCTQQQSTPVEIVVTFTEVQPIAGTWMPPLSHGITTLEDFTQTRSLYDATSGDFLGNETREVSVSLTPNPYYVIESFILTDFNNDGDYLDELLVDSYRITVEVEDEITVRERWVIVNGEAISALDYVQYTGPQNPVDPVVLELSRDFNTNCSSCGFVFLNNEEFPVVYNRQTETFSFTQDIYRQRTSNGGTRYVRTSYDPLYELHTQDVEVMIIPDSGYNVSTITNTPTLGFVSFGVYANTQNNIYRSYVLNTNGLSLPERFTHVSPYIDIQKEDSWEGAIQIDINNDGDMVDLVERRYIIYLGNTYYVDQLFRSNGWTIRENRN